MRRFRRYPPWTVWVCCLGACAIAGRYWWNGNGEVPHAALGSSRSVSLVPGKFTMVRMERGDLLVVRQSVSDPGTESEHELEATLQLLGVKSPSDESSADLREAGKEFSANFLSQGSPSLELDRRRLNDHGHFLAYAYVGGKSLNEELVRAGLARAETYPGDNQSLHRAFLTAEREARRAGRGIWAVGPK